ncbi:hypothetical protein G3567_07995 [Psychroflexus sp. YR1-1]|uniref:Uncharacterized protein n=1 Tax=Psychroflexus aurantiacus TaxID=2709310 RepID=A0A6B3R0K2_9FLAO|nr:hypothetical protein [Psychroflexus aurantiacus]NEV94086.1 hypothetical protein [Psychroflexus aurantiacus]
MNEIYFTKENIDENFKSMALSIIQQLEDSYTEAELEKIKNKNLKKIVEDLDKHKPKSHAREMKKNLLKYVNHFIEVPIKEYDEIELTTLEATYILPILNNRFIKYGYTLKWLWLWTLLFALSFDALLFVFIGKYYFYIPIITILLIPFIFMQIRTEIKAKKNNRLW